ncbi:MAG: DUF4214 domain-containing protein [Elusimicrobia bacterium]|nr:DUF4214 domain-containing protein [Elusimicrobiota bacterium]
MRDEGGPTAKTPDPDELPDRLFKTPNSALFKDPGISEELSLGGFVQILKDAPKTKKTGALVEDFMSKFKAAPGGLKPAYDTFMRRAEGPGGGKVTASDFMSAMRGNSSFRKLASEFMSSPGGPAFMAVAGSHPDMKKFLANEAGKVVRDNWDQAQRRFQRAAGAGLSRTEGAGSFGSRVSALGGDMGGSTGLGSTIRSQSAQLASGTIGLTDQSGGTTGIGGGASASGSGTTGAGAPPPSSAGVSNPTTGATSPTTSGTNGTTGVPLTKVPDIGTARKILNERFPWVFYQGILSDAQLLSLARAVMDEGFAPWAACFHLNLFDQCYRTCTGADGKEVLGRTMTCSLPPPPDGTGWTACMDGFDPPNNEITCFGYCSKESRCQTPAAIWQKMCVKPAGPAGIGWNKHPDCDANCPKEICGSPTNTCTGTATGTGGCTATRTCTGTNTATCTCTGTNTATCTQTNTDTGTGAWNPTDWCKTHGELCDLYKQELGRENAAIDEAGAKWWAEWYATKIAEGVPPNRLIDYARGLFNASPEAVEHRRQLQREDLEKNKGIKGEAFDSVWNAYVTLFGRTPDAGGLEYWAGRMSKGNLPASQIEAEMIRTQSQAEGVSPKNVDAVWSLYEKVMGRRPDSAGLTFWGLKMNEGMSASDLEATMKNSPEYQSTHTAPK